MKKRFRIEFCKKNGDPSVLTNWSNYLAGGKWSSILWKVSPAEMSKLLDGTDERLKWWDFYYYEE